MTASPLFFGVFAVVLVVAALAVVLSKNLFHSVLWLALALTGTAGIFLSLDAEFLAAVQLLLYAGGVITVVVFAIVVTERLVGERLSQTNRGMGRAAVAGLVLLAFLLAVTSGAPLDVLRPVIGVDVTRVIGDALLTRFALAFELLAVLLLTSLVGAIYLARPED